LAVEPTLRAFVDTRMTDFTHIRPDGGVLMVDVSDKRETSRTAIATGRVLLGEEAFSRVRDQTLAKGDVISVAQVAGIMGSKETSRLIPLCHPVRLQRVEVDISLDHENMALEVRAFAKSTGTTGVEMEALTGVSIACLTIYDMCKAITKDLVIDNIHLLAKTGGQSGDYRKKTDL